MLVAAGRIEFRRELEREVDAATVFQRKCDPLIEYWHFTTLERERFEAAVGELRDWIGLGHGLLDTDAEGVEFRDAAERLRAAREAVKQEFLKDGDDD